MKRIDTMKNFLSFNIRLAFSFYFLFSFSFLFAQDSVNPIPDASAFISNLEKSKHSVFDDLEDEPQLKITLESNFAELIENKNEDEYQPAVISYEKSNGEIFQTALKIKARGRYRRKVCDFPPLKLKFDKQDLVEDGYSPNYTSFKLVTHCLDTDEEKQNVIREYLAYKLYNELTPLSYEVKLIEITYLDSSGETEPTVRFGFLIENTKELSHRLGGEEIEKYNMDLSAMNTQDRQLFSMFQFMIGNTDWKTNMMHNIKIVQSDDGKEIKMIPYDFDFAGLVNTSYAKPNPDYKQVSVKQRIYMDKVSNLEELNEMILYFRKHKEGLFNIVKNMDNLDKKNKKEVLQYLKSFYNILDNTEEARLAFVNESL